MKKVILVVMMLALLGTAGGATFAVFASTGTMSVYGQFNQLACPVIPFNSDPRSESGPWASWLNEDDGLFNADYALFNDPTNGNSVQLPGQWTAFPNLLMGDGYVLTCGNPKGSTVYHTFTFAGVDISNTPAWISLPGMTGGQGGWHWVGIPYPTNTTVSFYDIVCTDGVEARTLGAMLDDDPGWIDMVFTGLDQASQNVINIPDQSGTMQGGQMYMVHTKKSNLAFILPAPNPAGP